MLRAILAVLMGAALAVGAGASQAREFRVADTQPEDYPTVQALYHMDRLIQEATGGRHRLQVFHSRQLGEEKETIEQTRVGAIDLNRTNVAPLASFAPEANVLVLPFLFRSTEHLHRVLDGPIGEEILASFEAHGFIGLAYYDSGARSIYNSVRPIRTLADVKGLKLRIQQSDLMLAMMQALGAVPVALPYGQVAAALSTHVIDGAENNWPSYVTTGHMNAARYYTTTEHTMSPEVLIVSKKAWASLDAEDRAILRRAARESSLFMRGEWRRWEERSRQQAKDAGVTIITDIDRKAFAEACAPIYAKAAADPRMQALIERIRAVE